MTSHFDHLVSLFSLTEKKEFPIEVLRLIYTEAVKELDKVDPLKITWEKWLKLNGIYQQLYRDGKMSLIETQKQFIDDCHDILDHNGNHHLKCFSISFLSLIEYINNACRSGLEEADNKYLYPMQAGSASKWKKIKVQYQSIIDAMQVHKTEIIISKRW